MANIKEWIINLWWIPAIILLFWATSVYHEWERHQPKPRNYVYACPDDDNSVKCYEITADYYRDCEDEGNGGSSCYSYITKMYFPNGGYVEFDNCDENKESLTCWPIDDRDGVWKIQLTGEKTKEKYYPNGTLAN